MKDCSLWLAGEAMAELCREFGISRKTGYKIFDRYQECGMQGLTDRSRRPYRYANQLPFQVENFILNVKHEHPSSGVLAKSVSACCAGSPLFPSRLKVPSMRCSSLRPGGAPRSRASSRPRNAALVRPATQ